MHKTKMRLMGITGSLFAFELKLLRNNNNQIQISPCAVPPSDTDPLAVFIKAFFRDDPTSCTTHDVRAYVKYSDNTKAFLVIIERMLQPKRAYVCEMGCVGSQLQRGLPSFLPTSLNPDGTLDVPVSTHNAFLRCLRNFVDSFCVMCCTAMADTWFSCEHLVTCVACARTAKVCPTCHTPIPDDGRFYLSDFFTKAPYIPKSDINLDQLEMVCPEGWILSQNQLQRIQQRKCIQKKTIRALWCEIRNPVTGAVYDGAICGRKPAAL